MPRSPRRFLARPRHPLTGRQFHVSAGTERELQAVLHRVDSLREDLRLGLKSEDEIDRALRRLSRGAVTLERAASSYASQTHHATNTRAAMASFVRGPGAELAALPLEELTAGRVQRWLDKLAARVSPGSCESYWRRLSALVRLAAAREWIGRSPWGSWKPVFRNKRRVRRREAARDLDELARLFEAARGQDIERAARGLLPDVEPKITAAAALGLRQGELAGLRWTDLLPAEGLITITRQWRGSPPKGKQPKTLTAAPALFELFERHRETLVAARLYSPAGPVFPCVAQSSPGRPRAYAKGECLTRRILRAVVRRAELPNENAWSAHSLRDTFATLEQHSHADLATLAQRTRHASLGSLLRYLRASHRALPPPGFALPRAELRPLLPVHKK